MPRTALVFTESVASDTYRTGPEARTPPLRERVYAQLKLLLNEGSLKPGVFLDLNALGNKLSLSRTPLRDALLRLEVEGFVTIHPRRGVVINPLDINTIRNAYQLLGALEAAAIIEAEKAFSEREAETMMKLNESMAASLNRNDFEAYYSANLQFHDVYLALSANAELKRMARLLKERLYDFPRREGYLREWEVESVREHAFIAKCLSKKDYQEAARYVRDVHWSFSAQERFIMPYYFAREAALGPLL